MPQRVFWNNFPASMGHWLHRATAGMVPNLLFMPSSDYCISSLPGSGTLLAFLACVWSLKA